MCRVRHFFAAFNPSLSPLKLQGVILSQRQITQKKMSGNFQSGCKLSRVSGNFPESLKTLKSIQNFFHDCLESFQTVWKHFQILQNLLIMSEIFLKNQKLFNLFGKFQKCPETLRVFENYLECPKTIQRVRKYSIVSGNFPESLQSFPECPETFQKKYK